MSRSTAVVATFHVAARNEIARRAARLLPLATVRSRNRIDGFIGVSEVAVALARDAYRLTDCAVIQIMIDVAALRSQGEASNVAESERGPSIVYFISSITTIREIASLIRAFGTLRDCTIQTQHRHHDRRQAARGTRYGIRSPSIGTSRRSRCWDISAIPQRSLRYAGADVACFPSGPGESFGVVLIEAMAAGSGVVVGGFNGGHRGVLEDEFGGVSRWTGAPRPSRRRCSI